MRDVSMVTTRSRIGWRTASFLLFAAIALRGWDLGNPVIHVDEQWYLLVGDRMLAGAVPYVDIWDRKPIGLFLLFAGLRLLPGDGVLAYQGAALLFAAATALIVAAASRRIGAARQSAAIAGVAYLLGLALFGGRGGQAPVFYNLPMAAAVGWLGAALLGFLAIGTFFDHYALPLAVIAGPALGRFRAMAGIVLTVWLAIWAVQTATARDDGPGARRVAAVVERNARGGCPYVFIGDTITYLIARACLPTAYAFPNLLAYTTEQGATGIDEAEEVRRILTRRPPVIVASTRRLAIWNPGSRRALLATLTRDYRLVASEPRQRWRTTVWLRRDLPLR